NGSLSEPNPIFIIDKNKDVFERIGETFKYKKIGKCIKKVHFEDKNNIFENENNIFEDKKDRNKNIKNDFGNLHGGKSMSYGDLINEFRECRYKDKLIKNSFNLFNRNKKLY